MRAVDERPRPRQLPREPVAFVGRSAELARMLTVLCGGSEPGAGPRVLALHGLGGVGKSALALRAAYAVIDRYADGQLYVDLQGSSPGLLPLRPAEVLGRFLRALGVPHGEVPAAPAEAATQYQSLLADRRFLVVLDNAVDAAQVAPLLPAGGGCAALVTSRAALTTMDAAPVAVDVFDEADSVRMLTLLAGRARVDAEAETAADIARWCGYHPLALRIAGARLAGRPDWSLTRFGERLRDQRRRLDELRAADLGVRSCFEVGYAALTSGSGRATDAAARAFRLFGVLAVPEVSVGHVAALLDAGLDVAEDALDELTEARLIEPVGDGRFRMHDLLRLFAAELAVIHDPPAERAQAVRRALDRYLDLCHQVNDLLQPHLGSDDGHRPSGRDTGVALHSPAEAARWFEAEIPCLIAAAVQAAEGEPAVASFVTDLTPLVRALATKFGHWREYETVARLAIEVARRDGDRPTEAAALTMLGLVEWRTGRLDAARDCLHRALELRRDLGDREAEGLALHNLGWLSMRNGDLDDALGDITAGLRLLEAHESSRVGMVMHNLGEALLRLGRFTEAADSCASSSRRPAVMSPRASSRSPLRMLSQPRLCSASPSASRSPRSRRSSSARCRQSRAASARPSGSPLHQPQHRERRRLRGTVAVSPRHFDGEPCDGLVLPPMAELGRQGPDQRRQIGDEGRDRRLPLRGLDGGRDPGISASNHRAASAGLCSSTPVSRPLGRCSSPDPRCGWSRSFT